MNEQLKKLLALADNTSRGVPIRENDDFGFMTMQFLYKQIQHAESLLILVPSRDAGLIARTMIEGRYQLLWSSQDPENRSKRWRSFSIIHDWRLIQGRIREGINVDPADIGRNEAGLRQFGDLHQIQKPKPNTTDRYYKNWRGGVSLSAMADAVGRELYDGPYSELSDWEHWGVSGIGDAISRQDGHLTVSPTSERITGLSLLAAFQCLFDTLAVADAHFSLGITQTIQEMTRDFVTTIASFYQTETHSTNPS